MFESFECEPNKKNVVKLEDIVCCPRCRSAMNLISAKPACTNTDCLYSREGFPKVRDQPVLIDFQRSLFARAAYELSHGADGSGSVIARRDSRAFTTRILQFFFGRNLIAPGKSRKFLERAKELSSSPIVLVIGGGAIGSGAEALYLDQEIQIVGTDVYASVNTHVLADGHHLPFRGEVFDGVWIQAVLEHVLEPHAVADEIYRVLKLGGVVYSEIPFMQQVHEGAYDFTRFTQAGQRWLFKRFQEIEAGAVSGAGVALTWSIQYFVRSLGFPKKIAVLAGLPFFWLRFLERFAKRRPNADASSGTFFFGEKSEITLKPKDMLSYYETQQWPRPKGDTQTRFGNGLDKVTDFLNRNYSAPRLRGKLRRVRSCDEAVPGPQSGK
jgi:SAM-dependent methyltransferase